MLISAVDSAYDLIRRGDFSGARALAEFEIEHASGQGSASEMWQLYLVRADALECQGRVEEALQYLESLAPPDPDDAKLGAEIKKYRGAYHAALGRYETSHRLLCEAESVAREGDFTELLADIWLARAFVFFLQKDYAESEQLYRGVLQIADHIGGWYYRGHGLWGVGKNLMIQTHYHEALPWLNESLQIFGNADALLKIAMVWSELAVCYLGLGDDERAMELFRKAEQVNRECGAVHNYQVVLANIGNVYLHRRDYFTAISYYQKAVTLAREIKDPVSVRKWTRNISLAYARIRAAVDQQQSRTA